MIVVVDYGMGNLRSVSKALESLGGSVCVTADPVKIKQCSKLVLPGVGAFGDASAELQKRLLRDPILGHIQSGKPFLGICLGLQLLLEASEESAGADGLGVFKGKVIRFRSSGVKIPHMGWNTVDFQTEGAHPLLKGITPGSHFYFVHSFYAAPLDPAVAVGKTEYGQENFAAILGKDNVFATQFHPEKSQEAGLKILKNFLEW
jgi:glutamine amidotransferase